MNKENGKEKDNALKRIINFFKNIISPKKEEKLLESSAEDNVSIELRHVSLSFKIGNDKIDNLKEYVIRTLKSGLKRKKLFLKLLMTCHLKSIKVKKSEL